jgi:outer membrane protein OmpA-like peptidoglycan-associated protein
MFRSLISGMIVAALLGMASALGCSGPGAQLTQCQSEKEQLLATIREQRDANRSLHEHVASLESRLDESEKEIARGGKTGTRLSSAPATKPRAEIADAKLAWKSPAKSAAKTAAASSGLAALAARDKRLALDRAPGLGRINVPIAFDDNSATLTAADKRQLDDVAKLLKSKEAAELKVLISGFAEGKLGTSRAQAVADYLDSHGIAEERLAVADSPRGSKNDAASSSVQILVAEKNAAVAGWGSGETIRR